MFLNNLNELKKGATVCIYGQGETGLALKNNIQRLRQDIIIKCFIDSFNSGEIDGYKVIKFNKSIKQNLLCDYIIIASVFSFQIKELLDYNNITNYLIIGDNLIFKFSNLDILGEFYWSKDKIANNNRVEKSKKLFTRLHDIDIFNALINVHNPNKTLQHQAQNFFLKKGNFEKQYLDHIPSNSIRNIIEGGVAEGSDTSKFLNNFKNLECIYGFEPFSFLFEKELAKFKNNKKIKIYNIGIGNKESRISVNVDQLLTSNNVLKEKKTTDEHSLLNSVQISRIDTLFEKETKIDLIKLDIEGYEYEALMGAKKLIQEQKPILAISIYHKKEDIIEIPLLLKSLVKEYTFYLENYSSSSIDTVLYAIPENN